MKHSLFDFMEDTIVNLKEIGKMRTSETYTSTLNSFKCFRNNKNILLSRVDSNLILAYEAYLKGKGITPNSSSFYMRNLRAVYNKAVDKELVRQNFPFKHVYTGIDKTVKRAVSIRTIKRIKELDLTANQNLEFARDIFLFSFYTRGMSFIDIAYLKKKDIKKGILIYRRCKTQQLLCIKWEMCMQDIVDKYTEPESVMLLPIISSFKRGERDQYIYMAHRINRHLRRIGEILELPMPLTMYVARHAWASIAKSKNIPLSVISEGMGHDSENTTRIYLASLNSMAIDRANRLILKSI